MNPDAKATGSRDVIDFLKGQHEQIKGLFERVMAAEGEDRAKFFSQLKNLMSAHEAAEEEVVHPVADRALAGGRAEVTARLKEEAEAKKALSALEKLDVSSGDFETKFRTLQKAVLAHAKSEEKEEFDKLADKLDEKKLKEMRKAVQVAEAGATAQAAASASKSANGAQPSAGHSDHAPHRRVMHEQ